MTPSMDSRRSVPFQNLSRAAWRNLAIAGLFAFYLAQIALDVRWGNLFANVGADFGAFWSAGHIANHIGYRFVYDLDSMRAVQRDLVPPAAGPLVDVRTIPAPFLPVFILPFQLMSLLPPVWAFAAWSLLNILGTALYLRRFISRLAPRGLDHASLLLCLVSAPTFFNLFLGQANLWLMICVGESLLALSRGHAARSGAWLAGLLLKPQLLVLIVPALARRRQFRTLAAFGLGSALLLGLSWLLGGSEAMQALVRLWLGYAGGLPTNDIQLMMNWRMLALQLSAVVGTTLAQVVLIAGSAITALSALALWFRRTGTDETSLALMALGIWAATASVAWHSHVHMGVILIPPLLMFAAWRSKLGPEVLTTWILIPAFAFIIRIGLAVLPRIGALPPSAYSWIDSLGALAQLGADLWLLVLAVTISRAHTQSSSPPVGAAAG